MSGFEWKVTITNPDYLVEDFEQFEYSGEGDDFGGLVADLLVETTKATTGEPMPPEAVADIINTALDAWRALETNTSTKIRAQRREFSDPESNFDLTIELNMPNPEPPAPGPDSVPVWRNQKGQ